MGRKLRRGAKVNAHVRLYGWMLDTPAYRSLGLPARALLVELYALYNGTNNGQIYPGVRGAATRIGAGASVAVKAFHELEDRGFIRAAERGAFTRKNRQATRWVLTEFEYSGQLASREFMRWAPRPNVPEEKQNTVSKIDTVGIENRHRGLRAVV